MKKIEIGSWITLNNPLIAEIMSNTSLDWLCIDMEHSVIDLETAQLMTIAIQSNGKKAFIRVPENNKRIIKRCLDIGIDGIIIPNVNSYEEAINSVRYVNYPPVGERGVGLARAQKYGFDFENYRNNISKNIEIIVQVEHYQSVNDLEKILSIDGIHGTLIGPFDLSGSVGKPGDWNDPEVKKLLDKYETINKRYDKKIGFHVIEPDFNVVNEKINLGYNFIAFSLDSLLLGTTLRNNLNKIER